MKVKIFEEDEIKYLEKDINEFLKKDKCKNLHDIKYIAYDTDVVGRGYSVMIMYE